MKTDRRFRRGGRLSAGLLTLLAASLAGCEAPLDMSQVQREIAKPIHRFDQLKAAAVNHRRILVVGDYGTVLSTTDQGQSWQRTRLPNYLRQAGIDFRLEFAVALQQLGGAAVVKARI